jgi:hypothetical protein
MALNGPSYPGYGPNIIKEFRPDEYDSVDLIKEELIDALIYPVPALENINIDISDALIGGHYNIIDYHGKIVMEGGLNSNTQVIQVNSLARGSYYLFLQNGDNMITRTFTLQ